MTYYNNSTIFVRANCSIETVNPSGFKCHSFYWSQVNFECYTKPSRIKHFSIFLCLTFGQWFGIHDVKKEFPSTLFRQVCFFVFFFHILFIYLFRLYLLPSKRKGEGGRSRPWLFYRGRLRERFTLFHVVISSGYPT